MSAVENTEAKTIMKRTVVILLGGPGAGKGTQAEAIRDLFKIPHISTGQMLRSEAAAATPVGLCVKAIMAAGALVPDEIVNDLIRQRIHQEDCKTGLILDGYPRNVSQAVALDAALPIRDRQIVIEIVTDLEKMLPRLTSRRTCPSCGAIYHLVASPPTCGGVCDHCSGKLVQRSDDTEDVIRERFKAYQDVTERLTDLYQRMQIYHSVDGMRPPDDVGSDIRRLLEHEMFSMTSASRVAAD
jgi:adenylate kinase